MKSLKHVIVLLIAINFSLQLNFEQNNSIKLSGHYGSVRSLIVLPDGSFASGGDDGKIILWDYSTCKILKTLKVHSSSVECLVVLPDDYWLVLVGIIQSEYGTC